MEIFHSPFSILHLLHEPAAAEGRSVVVEVLFDGAYHAVLDVDDFVRLVGHAAFVGHDDDGHARLVEVLQDLHHFDRGLAVEGARGLVGQDDLRTGDEGAGDGHTLLLSAAHLVGHVVGPVLQPQAVEVLQRQGVALLAADALVEQGQGHVLHRVLERDEVERLEDEAYHAVAVLGGARLAQVLDEGAVQVVFARVVAVQDAQYIK